MNEAIVVSVAVFIVVLIYLIKGRKKRLSEDFEIEERKEMQKNFDKIDELKKKL